MKKILLFCVVTMMAISVSWAQRTVTGTVTGEEDGISGSRGKRHCKRYFWWHSHRH
jgi:hypothetical protein